MTLTHVHSVNKAHDQIVSPSQYNEVDAVPASESSYHVGTID